MNWSRKGTAARGVQARVEPFLFAMDREIRTADLVVCRAGATTIAELTAAGRPALLVPLPTAADDHQRKNAEVLAAAGAAEIVEQKHLTGALIAERIATLIGDPARLAAMSAAARTMSRPNAARVIADRATGVGREADVTFLVLGSWFCRSFVVLRRARHARSYSKNPLRRRRGQRHERHRRAAGQPRVRRDRLGREAIRRHRPARAARRPAVDRTRGRARRSRGRRGDVVGHSGGQPGGRRGAAPRKSR